MCPISVTLVGDADTWAATGVAKRPRWMCRRYGAKHLCGFYVDEVVGYLDVQRLALIAGERVHGNDERWRRVRRVVCRSAESGACKTQPGRQRRHYSLALTANLPGCLAVHDHQRYLEARRSLGVGAAGQQARAGRPWSGWCGVVAALYCCTALSRSPARRAGLVRPSMRTDGARPVTVTRAGPVPAARPGHWCMCRLPVRLPVRLPCLIRLAGSVFGCRPGRALRLKEIYGQGTEERKEPYA